MPTTIKPGMMIIWDSNKALNELIPMRGIDKGQWTLRWTENLMTALVICNGGPSMKTTLIFLEGDLFEVKTSFLVHENVIKVDAHV